MPRMRTLRSILVATAVLCSSVSAARAGGWLLATEDACQCPKCQAEDECEVEEECWLKRHCHCHCHHLPVPPRAPVILSVPAVLTAQQALPIVPPAALQLSAQACGQKADSAKAEAQKADVCAANELEELRSANEQLRRDLKESHARIEELNERVQAILDTLEKK